MKDIVINPKMLNGKIIIPSSKSLCHRAIICAGLSKVHSHISNVIFSKDIEATCGAMSALGVNIDIKEGNTNLLVKGVENLNSNKININCFESGSTLRFFIPIACTTGGEVTFKGEGKLVERPLEDYYSIFKEQGIKYSNHEGKLPLSINGKLSPGEYKVKGDVSSQFITGLLFALPLLTSDSKIIVTTELESKGYIDLTLDMLKNFSVQVENRGYREFIIKGNQQYSARDYRVEGDFSQVAFWLVAGALGGNIDCEGINVNSLQGDKVIIDIIEKMGGKITIEGDKIKASPKNLKATVIDVSQCPDLVPIVAVLGALSKGTTEIINGARVRFKESDRLKAITTELNKIGANIEEREAGLIIRGVEAFKGGIVNSWNDHRIAMALAIASMRCTEPLIIEGAQSVNKSYPNFWKDFIKLGGDLNEWNMGK